MSPIHLVIGGLCAAVTIGLITWIALYETPGAQHVLVKNDFEDARCEMNFFNGARGEFSVAKGGEYKTRYNQPIDGFVIMHCNTASRRIEGPAGLYFVKGGLTTLTLNPQGSFELVFKHNTKDCRQCAYGVDPEKQSSLH